MTQVSADSNIIVFPLWCIENRDKKTIKEVSFEWLFLEKADDIKNRTLEWYYYEITNHLFPILGNQEINHINFNEVLNHLKKKSRSASRTTKIASNLFKRIMEYAIEKGYLIYSMPFHKLKSITYTNSSELKYIPQYLREFVIDAAAQHPILYPLLITGMFLGLRPGEIIALTWDNINFRTGIIKVN